MQFQGESSDHSDTQTPIKVKISGDGARMTRNSNYIILSFSILQKEDELMSSRGTWQYSLQHMITELPTKRADESLIGSQHYLIIFNLIR